MVLLTFLPMILLALIIIIILLIRKNNIAARKTFSREENDKETGNRENNDLQNVTESGVYTELENNREPDNTYMSLVHHENPCGNSGPSCMIENYTNHVMTPQSFRAPDDFSYVIRPPSH